MATSADHFDYMYDWQETDGGIDLTGNDDDPWVLDDSH